jgi:transposase-like protein
MKTKNELPKTLPEAITYFSNPDVALQFVVSMRWPNGVRCPRCGSAKVSFTAKRRVWTCEECPGRRQFSVKVGTVMEDSPIGLDKWLVGMWLVASAKNGISSHEIHRALGITQKSAWFMGHRIRLALQSGTMEKLSGEVEADATNIESQDHAYARHIWPGATFISSQLKDEFNLRADRWRMETSFQSSLVAKFMHEDYQIIMAMGTPAIPLILTRLKTAHEHWFWALKHLARKDVAEGIDNPTHAARAWLKWGKEKGYID